jgi:hypothetical protein
MNDKELLEKDIFSKVLRAGRRTYFFDVRATTVIKKLCERMILNLMKVFLY